MFVCRAYELLVRVERVECGERVRCPKMSVGEQRRWRVTENEEITMPRGRSPPTH